MTSLVVDAELACVAIFIRKGPAALANVQAPMGKWSRYYTL